MVYSLHGRPPTRRHALGDATLRANEDHSGRSPRHDADKSGLQVRPSSSPKLLPHNESLVPDGTLAVRRQLQPSPVHKRVSAVVNDEVRPHNPKRDSEVSNVSTNASSTTNRRKTHIGPWHLGKTIGRGGCARVRIVRHSVTGQYGAAKIISKKMAESVRALSLANLIQSAQHDPTLFPGGKVIPFGLEREICIMKLLDHPNIVRLYDVWENRNELYLVMEYVEGGDLFSYIREYGALPEIHVVVIFRQIIAALLYCHRFNIHHRDLKPENILVDRETLNIKLVDFGMAALQPRGQKLTTPCGSPHYAAPEVIRTTPYDGGMADVWSCGVILYLLLTGVPPFNWSGDETQLVYLYRAIASAKYVMPDNLSREAQNLIRRIFVPNPTRRIPIDQVWSHPFLRQYDRQLGIVGEKTTQEYWVGAILPLDGWKPLNKVTIDREILRYMRTLWHSEKEEVLIQKLANDEVNQEKYFYAALQKYQHDQLENYVPSAHHAITYSNSDHHHHGRVAPSYEDILQIPSKKHNRSQSGYSILNDEHLYSKHSFYQPPSSDVSYDPFRASREPIIPNQAPYQNVTVHRESSSGSRKLRPATALGHHTGSSLRVHALRNSRRGLALSPASSKRSTPSQRSVPARPGSVSRSSIASSRWPSSPPIVARPGSLGRRGVSFSHLRRSSAVTASTIEASVVQHTPEQQLHLSRSRGSKGSSTLSSRPSTIDDSPTVRSFPKAAAKPVAPRLKPGKPESPSKYIQSEARKVSTELEKVMEEAFNRSSISSTVRTCTTEPRKEPAEYDSPPTSFSNRDSGRTALETPENKATFQNRPLPPVPNETPNTFLQRKLAETRAEIARRLEEGGDNTEHFNEVLDHLDRLLIPTAPLGKRAVSAPAKSPEHPAPLHVIPEEVKTDGDDLFESYSPTFRAVTDPTRPTMHGRATIAEQTIRLVDRSPTRIAPLNIRKRSGASTSTKSGNDGVTVPWPGPSLQAGYTEGQGTGRDISTICTNQAAQINTVPNVADKVPVVKKKMSSWFRRSPEGKEAPTENQQTPVPARYRIPDAWKDLDDRIKDDPPPRLADPLPLLSEHATKTSDGSSNSEFPMRNCGTAPGKSEGGGAFKGLFGFFGKKTKDEKSKPLIELGVDNFSTSSILSGFNLEGHTAEESAARPGPPEFQMNWLSRFLHIKPACKVLCFHVRRGKVRQDLVRLLRDWQRFGVRDVSLDRNRNVINARIHKNNHLKIKPVAFVIELFVVLEQGRRANLSLARFTQTRGAASSFRKTVDVIEDVCRNKYMLIEDEEKRAAMCDILG